MQSRRVCVHMGNTQHTHTQRAKLSRVREIRTVCVCSYVHACIVCARDLLVYIMFKYICLCLDECASVLYFSSRVRVSFNGFNVRILLKTVRTT